MQFTGKSVNEALENGLIELKVTSDEVKYTVVQDVKKGLFGRIKSPAIVEIELLSDVEGTKKEEKKENKKPVKKTEKKQGKIQNEKGLNNAKNFLSEVLGYLGYSSEITVGNDGENDVLTLTGDNSSEVIGYRGEVLDALQTLASAVANIGKDDYKKVVVDCESYRERRQETLVNLAKRLEAKATEMKRDVCLEPMNPFERRIIHTALANSETVTSKSEGKEPNRYVVIVPNDRDEFAKPYNAGRNNKDRKGDKRSRDGRRDKGGFKPKSNGGNKKKSSSLSFGTYLGNSLKDNKEE